MGIVILITFGVIVVFVMAFKKNTSETTVTRKDEKVISLLNIMKQFIIQRDRVQPVSL